MKKILLSLLLIVPLVALATTTSTTVIRDSTGFIRPSIQTDYIVSPYFIGTSTTASFFPSASTTNFTIARLFYLPGMSNGCLQVASGLATSTGVNCGSGSGGSSATTTINGVQGPTFTFATSTSGNVTLSIATSTGMLTFTPGVTSGFNIPLTASTTNWNSFYDTPSTRITAGANLLWTGNTLGFNGVLPVANGGTATSTAPTLGQLLLGNGSGTYNLVATSSLGIPFTPITWLVGSGFIYNATSSDQVLIGTSTPGTNTFLIASSSQASLGITGYVTNTGITYSLTNGNCSGCTFSGIVNGSTTANSNMNTIPLTSTFTNGAGLTNGMVFSSRGGPILWGTGGVALTNERMRLDTIGDLMIGTTSADHLVEIYGGTAGGSLRVSRTTTATNAAVGTLKVRAITSNSMADAFGPSLAFYAQDTDNVENYTGDIRTERKGADNTSDMVFVTPNSGSAVEKFRIQANGNVDVGTSTGSSLFNVAGDINATGSLRFKGDAGTTGYVLLSQGSGPSPIWVATSSLGITGGSGGTNQWTLGNGYAYWATTTDSLLVGTSSNQFPAKFYVQSGSTTQPTLVAQATSSQTSPVLDIWSSTSNSLLNVNPSGSVGVSTSTPDKTFTVFGNAHFGTSTVSTMYIDSSVRGVGINKQPIQSGITCLPTSTSCIIIRENDDGNDATILAANATEGTISMNRGGSLKNFLSAGTGVSNYIANLGGFGLSTTTPLGRLIVVGSSTGTETTFATYPSGTGVPSLLVNDSSYIGVNNQTPCTTSPVGFTINSKTGCMEIRSKDATGNLVFSLRRSDAGTGLDIINDTGIDGHTQFNNRFGGTGVQYLFTSGSTPTNLFSISGNGRIGLGTTTPTARLFIDGFSLTEAGNLVDVVNASGAHAFTLDNGTMYSQWYNGGGINNLSLGFNKGVGMGVSGTAVTSTLSLGSNNAPNLFITSAGKVGIGTSSPTFTALTATGTVGLTGLTAGSGTMQTLCWKAGEVVLGSGTDCSTSNLDMKKDVHDNPLGLETLRLFNPIEFTRTDSDEKRLGFGAQDVEKIDPRLVFYNQEGKLGGIDIAGIVSINVKATQELDKRVTDIEKDQGPRPESQDPIVWVLGTIVLFLGYRTFKLERKIKSL